MCRTFSVVIPLLFLLGLQNAVASQDYSLCFEHVHTQPNIAEQTCTNLLEQDYETSDLNIRTRAYISLASALTVQGEYAKAQQLLDAAFDENPLIKEENLYRYNWLRQRGVIYFSQGNFDQALPVMQSTLRLIETIETVPFERQQQIIATSNNDVASTLMELGRYQEAMEYYQRSLTLFTDMGRHYSAALSLAGIAIAHKDLGDQDTAIKFFERAIDSHRLHQENAPADAYSITAQNDGRIHLAEIYIDSLKFQEARVLLEQAKNVFTRNENPVELLRTLVALSKIALANKDLDQAGGILKEAELLEDEQGLSPSLDLQKQLTIYYTASMQTAKALEIAKSALKQAFEQEHLQSKLFYLKWLAEHYSERQEYKYSQEYYNAYFELYESFLGAKYNPAVADLRSIIEVKQQQQEIALLERDQHLANFKLQQQKWVIGLSLLFLLILTCLCLVLWRQKTRQQVSLQREINMHRNELQRLSEQDSDFDDELDGNTDVHDKASHDLASATSTEPAITIDTQAEFHRQLVELMCLSCEFWEQSTGLNQIELAEKSKIWLVVIDDGRLRTRTMDKYLSFQRLPKKPRWRQVVRTCRFVLVECKLSSQQRDVLNDCLEKTLNMHRQIATQG